MTAPFSEETAAVIRRDLLNWYHQYGRDLPWRHTRDPYAIWVSEIMLQQTTVAVVKTRWQSFLERFPTLESLAHAPLEDVMAEWSGLGYYSRARHLKKAAEIITETGEKPATREEWRKLPGIGPYTSAAISSIAHGEPVAAVDGNTLRAVSRLLAEKEALKRGTGTARVLSAAETLLERTAPGDHNQAMMDLGALLCTPRNPACNRCPLKPHCLGSASGQPEDFPQLPPKTKSRTVHLAAAICLHEGAIFLVDDTEFVSKHWSVPVVRLESHARPDLALAAFWQTNHGKEATVLGATGSLSHAVLDRRYQIQLLLLDAKPEDTINGSWFPLARVSQLERGGFLNKVLRHISEPGSRPPAFPEAAEPGTHPSEAGPCRQRPRRRRTGG